MPFSGEKLREIRERVGVERGDLATLAGTSKQYVSHLENGVKGNPAFDLVEKLANALGVGVADFIADTAPLARKAARPSKRKPAGGKVASARAKG